VVRMLNVPLAKTSIADLNYAVLQCSYVQFSGLEDADDKIKTAKTNVNKRDENEKLHVTGGAFAIPLFRFRFLSSSDTSSSLPTSFVSRIVILRFRRGSLLLMCNRLTHSRSFVALCEILRTA
jgi:hypothetical protein